jgi:hypothetical protein
MNQTIVQVENQVLVSLVKERHADLHEVRSCFH